MIEIIFLKVALWDYQAVKTVRKLVHPETTLARASLLMDQLKCRNLPVISDDKIVGVISDRDIEHLVEMYGQGFSRPESRLKVGNYMKAPVKAVDADHSLDAVIRMMLDRRIEAVIIEKDGSPLATITRDDMLEILADYARESKARLIDHLGALLQGPLA